MKLTSLCYIERDGKYLMLHRTRKKNDENSGKWIGVGGKFKEGESPEECVRRETLEETGLKLSKLRLRGIITFVSSEWGTEYMHLFTAESLYGEVKDCDEGELQWVDKSEILNLNLWQGDRIFLKLLREEKGFFSLKLVYRSDTLTEARIDEQILKID